MKSFAAVISALALLAVALPAPVSARVLAVPVRTQQQSEWCWAGCTQAILFYYGHSVTQTTIAQYGTNGRNIPNYGWGSGWIDGTWCRGNDLILNHFGSINSTGRNYPLAQTTVTSEINAGRPFIITWQWDSGGGHFIVGRGISGSNVYYMDPWHTEGHKVASYDWVRRNAANGHTWTQTLQLTTNPPQPVTATRAPLQLYASDFTGNGKSNVVIFRPSSGLWAVRGVTRVTFGRSGDIPVPADYNGSGRANIAVFRPSTGQWMVRHVTRFAFGRSGDIPIPMNHRPGYTTAGIFRPSSGLWAFRLGGRFYFGRSGDIPVIGPWATRDGKWGAPRIAIFRPSTGLWSVRGLTRFYFGRSGDIPVPGAYSTSRTEPWKAAVFRPSSGLWSVRGMTRVYFGRSGDIPVPADYNVSPYDWGDKITIFRPSTGMWRIRGYQPFYFGRSGDIPAVR